MSTRRIDDQKVISHKIGTRKDWLAARLELLKEEKELIRRSDELARLRQELPWVFQSTRSIASRPTKEKHFSLISSEGARRSSSTTSCSGPTGRLGVHPAR